MCDGLSPLPILSLFVKVVMRSSVLKIEARSTFAKTWNAKKASAMCPKVAEAESTCKSSDPSGPKRQPRTVLLAVVAYSRCWLYCMCTKP